MSELQANADNCRGRNSGPLGTAGSYFRGVKWDGAEQFMSEPHSCGEIAAEIK